MGETEFVCERVEIAVDPVPFLPASVLNDLRRNAAASLREARLSAHKRNEIKLIKNSEPYPTKEITYLGNALNQKAVEFYRRHGVEKTEMAAEAGLDLRGRKVMTTKYCLRYELDACLKTADGKRLSDPLTLTGVDGKKLILKFNCRDCVMEVYYGS